MKYTFPEDYGQKCSFVICIDATLIPLVAGALKHFEEERSWHDFAEYEKAYNAFAELELQMTKLCIEQLIESNDRLYRLIDAAMFGREYTVIATDPLIASPEIPLVPDMTAQNPGLIARLALLQKSADNAWNGTLYTEFTNPVGMRAQLQELIDKATEGNGLDAEMLADLGELVVLLA